MDRLLALPPVGVKAIVTLTLTRPTRLSVWLDLPDACTVNCTPAGLAGVDAYAPRTPAPLSVSVPAPGAFTVSLTVPLPRSAFAAPIVNKLLGAACGV